MVHWPPEEFLIFQFGSGNQYQSVARCLDNQALETVLIQTCLLFSRIAASDVLQPCANVYGLRRELFGFSSACHRHRHHSL